MRALRRAQIGALAIFWAISPAALSKGHAGWIVAHDKLVRATTRLRSLTLLEGAALRAPVAHILTLTVDSVGTAILPGRYRGNIVLTVARDIPMQYKKLAPVSYAASSIHAPRVFKSRVAAREFF